MDDRDLGRVRAEAEKARELARKLGPARIGSPEGIPRAYGDSDGYFIAATTFFKASRFAYGDGNLTLGALYYQMALAYQGLGEMCLQLR